MSLRLVCGVMLDPTCVPRIIQLVVLVLFYQNQRGLFPEFISTLRPFLTGHNVPGGDLFILVLEVSLGLLLYIPLAQSASFSLIISQNLEVVL